MATGRSNGNRHSRASGADSGSPADEPGPVTRRAPFSDNPTVGPRGQRTQQRILDAALQVFGEDGYHQCSIDRITKAAGCSRVSFYQYFGSKEDVFRQLAGQVARQLSAATEALEPLTPDASGWAALHAWLAREEDIYERYESVYRVFPAASESDETVAVGSARYGARAVARIRARLATTDLPSRQLDLVLQLLLECRTRTLDVARLLRSAAPEAYPRDRIERATTDVFHRTLFGLLPEINVHAAPSSRPPRLEFDRSLLGLLGQADPAADVGGNGQRVLTALLDSGRDVFIQRGYHGTRVDDLAKAAGVSHGAFYRYFQNKDQLARILTARAMRTVSTAFDELPALAIQNGAAGRAALRRWLRRYNATHANEAAMLRVWVDAAFDDPGLSAESATPFDWGRRRVALFLAPRGFGDVEMEAVVMVGLLAVFGSEPRPADLTDATATIIERGLLGR